MLCYQFYLQDTKSSNGTFVNNQRLSKGAEESPPREVCSGDIVQFGVDVMENSRKGEFILVCIKMCYDNSKKIIVVCMLFIVIFCCLVTSLLFFCSVYWY
jgi:hypothetical protein